MNVVVKMEFGSVVYGTSLPTSDIDIKGVYIPEGRDILLGRVKETISHNSKPDPLAKNGPDDIDEEIFSLKKYCQLLAEGQTVALDMLFVPSKHLKIWNPPWINIRTNRDRFFSRQSASFVGYCRTQANKYGIKGSRVAATRAFVEWLKGKEGNFWLSDFRPELEALVGEHSKFVMCKGPNGTEEEHFEVCNRKIPMHSKIHYALERFQKLLDEYGARALAAESNQGVDWKALSHAVRIANQAVEFLTTSNITFPRPEAADLLNIRKGELPYKQVAEMVEAGIESVEAAVQKSSLPDKPDYEYIDDLVYNFYKYNIGK